MVTLCHESLGFLTFTELESSASQIPADMQVTNITFIKPFCLQTGKRSKNDLSGTCLPV